MTKEKSQADKFREAAEELETDNEEKLKKLAKSGGDGIIVTGGKK